MTELDISFVLNGEERHLRSAAHRTLLEVLREDLGLTGTKTNCQEAECGVCTVCLDGKAVTACIILIGQCDGRRVETIEGLAEGGRLHPLQDAFIEFGAVQCGYCIPGMIMTAKSFLGETPSPDETAVREAIVGTLCRCTGYQKIVDAILAASRQMNQRPDHRHDR